MSKLKRYSSFKEYQEYWRKSPRGRFSYHKREAKKRNIGWLFTFEQWWKIWQESGYWIERGTMGYHMCRYGDVGPYSVDNVYIAHHTKNKRDAWYNGRLCYPPRKKKRNETTISKEQRQGIPEESSKNASGNIS